jgi:hypothetical protein
MAHPGEWVKREFIRAYNTPQGGDGGYMPLELLRVEARA